MDISQETAGRTAEVIHIICVSPVTGTVLVYGNMLQCAVGCPDFVSLEKIEDTEAKIEAGKSWIS